MTTTSSRQASAPQTADVDKSPLKRPLRVAMFIHSLAGGGAERVAVDLTGHWVDDGRDVLLITQADVGEDVYPLHPGVRRAALRTAGYSGGGWRGMAANVRRVRALKKLFRDFQPDVVVGMMTTASILAILAARGLPCAVIATEHTHPASQRLSRVWQRLRRFAYPRADIVVALTVGTANWISKHVPGSHLAVIPNAVHWPLPKVEPVLVPPAPSARRYLLAVGRLHYDKGFDLLLTAFAKIAGAHPDWDLIILGEGAERDALQAQIRQADLSDRVMLPGRAGNVGDWYDSAHLYVLSSRFEGLSNTLLESMASGLAAVAFDCETGPREIIRVDLDGVLVRPDGNPQALALALSSVMADERGRARMARNAIDVRERFSAQSVLARWRDTFEQALAASAKSRRSR
jgi:glycosyltransferase involved in cell wall biosynthesis